MKTLVKQEAYFSAFSVCKSPPRLQDCTLVSEGVGVPVETQVTLESYDIRRRALKGEEQFVPHCLVVVEIGP
jgi:hypothetical protein